MENREIFNKLYLEAKALMERRFTSEGGVGAVMLEDGSILTSVWNETLNSAVDLCAETGAILEAHKLNKKITHSLCLIRDENGSEKIIAPCGVCQERLFYFGKDVVCAINSDVNDIKFKSLNELQPYYWNKD